VDGSALRRGGSLAAAVLALCLASGAAVGGVVGGPAIATGLTGGVVRWHAGTPPKSPAPVLAAASAQAPTPTAAGVSATLAPLINAAGLGGHMALSVVDVASGQPLYSLSPDTQMVPASVTKLVTAAAALATRGPAYRIPTRAVAGTAPGDVVLVGGGDPTLAAGATTAYPGAGRLDELASQVRKALGDGTAPTRVVYDGSLYTGDVLGPGWDPDATTGGFGSPVTALMVDGARVNAAVRKSPSARSPQPDVAAAQAFARALGLPVSAVVAGTAPANAKELGKVESLPLVRLVEIMLTDSDNVIAEALARQVALARGQPASFAGAADATRQVLTDLGVSVAGYSLADGSGLSRLDRLSPTLLTAVLSVAARADQPALRGVFTGLPVAGYSGTLANRYKTPQGGASGAGVVRAKTGTLTGVSSIAGIAIDADGRALAFAVLADAVVKGTPAAQEALDRIAAALAGCGCR
jgi:D-alanyl-D-alanine carboxypeptidase/D-alanyl-D-alanine-endopeptidase (penicillin-binding protein 4)